MTGPELLSLYQHANWFKCEPLVTRILAHIRWMVSTGQFSKIHKVRKLVAVIPVMVDAAIQTILKASYECQCEILHELCDADWHGQLLDAVLDKEEHVQERLQTRRCHNCNAVGHFINACPHPRKRRTSPKPAAPKEPRVDATEERIKAYAEAHIKPGARGKARMIPVMFTNSKHVIKITDERVARPGSRTATGLII
jgi:hypothetical protein